VRPDRRHRQAVPEQQVVRHGQRVEQERLAGGVRAQHVAERHVHERLVQRDPQLDPVAQCGRHQARVLGEPVRRVPVQPAAVVLQRLRQVPVEQRGDRVDAVPQQLVDKPVVEPDATRVDLAGARRLDPRPGDREAVRVDAQISHQLDVRGIPDIVVAGDPATAPVGDAPRLRGERVPDRGPPSARRDRALDLIRRGGHPPQEAGREPHRTS
jgi:hypothetical protein